MDRFGKIEAITHNFKIYLLNEFRLNNEKRRINALQVVNLQVGKKVNSRDETQIVQSRFTNGNISSTSGFTVKP